MEFRLRKDAREWFRGIRGQMDLDFDPYYLCLMAGLAARRKTTEREINVTEDTAELVDSFPRLYQEQGKLIIALFLATELELAEIDTKERAAVHRLVEHYVSNETLSRLTDEGMKELNRYSYGGFEAISEWFSERPRSLETFLPAYRQRLNEEILKREAERG